MRFAGRSLAWPILSVSVEASCGLPQRHHPLVALDVVARGTGSNCIGDPRAIDEMKKRGWEFMGHGTTNSETLAGLPREKERDTVRARAEDDWRGDWKRPRGWLGPGDRDLQHPRHSRRGGRHYCGDWNNDDQPFR